MGRRGEGGARSQEQGAADRSGAWEKGSTRVSYSFVKPERLWLKAHPQYTEKWVQKLIADDPSILGLGDLVLRDQERVQPRAGRLDLLLQDPETKRRYEVELQ